MAVGNPDIRQLATALGSRPVKAMLIFVLNIERNGVKTGDPMITLRNIISAYRGARAIELALMASFIVAALITALQTVAASSPR
jgi:hypothetical protein